MYEFMHVWLCVRCALCVVRVYLRSDFERLVETTQEGALEKQQVPWLGSPTLIRGDLRGIAGPAQSLLLSGSV